MFHVRDDFRAGEPISAVPASWFNKVGSFINNLVGGRGVTVRKNESGPSVIELEFDEDALTATTEWDDRKDSPTAEDAAGDNWEWTAGGTAGLVFDAYRKVEEDGAGTHYLQRCRLKIAKDGRIIKVQALPERVAVYA